MYEIGVEHVLPLTTRDDGPGVLEEQRRSGLVSSASYRTQRPRSDATGQICLVRGVSARTGTRTTNRSAASSSRCSGRSAASGWVPLNGWVTAERVVSRSGYTGLNYGVATSRASRSTSRHSSTRTSRGFSFQGLLRLGTPSNWGNIYGYWAWSIEQSYTGAGGQIIYNPNLLDIRDIPKENFLEYAASFNTNMRLTKSFRLAGSRTIAFNFDITNVFNKKSLTADGERELSRVDHRPEPGGEELPRRRQGDVLHLHGTLSGLEGELAEAAHGPAGVAVVPESAVLPFRSERQPLNPVGNARDRHGQCLSPCRLFL